MALLDYIWVYYTLYNGSNWLYLSILHYLTLPHPTTAQPTSKLLHSIMSLPSLTLLQSTTALLGSTWFYYIVQWLDDSPCMTVLHSTYHSSTWLYFTLPHSTVALLGSTWFYLTLLHSIPSFNQPLLHCTKALLGSTWPYLTLLQSTMALYLVLLESVVHSTMALIGSSWVYHTLPWLYWDLLDSTLPHSTIGLRASTLLNYTLP